jgi:hypothetical protein
MTKTKAKEWALELLEERIRLLQRANRLPLGHIRRWSLSIKLHELDEKLEQCYEVLGNRRRA